MTMTREAMEKILEIGTVETHKIGEQTYATQRLHLVQEPTPAPCQVDSIQKTQLSNLSSIFIGTQVI
ncbi:hypothetical protein [Bacillus thuringiensis]|uniref:Uncharacterized protein n=1 Tax=Bacillus thuringiensis serovar andalousiensis TaxID=257985 RepID=A0A6H0TNG8_BACTU|nr:hypothetical protein [Bacillus thuringiensis]QIW22492.1 hypothetical protein EVG22_31570 [Bacillus thuringiensis serovar andalousiensis]